MNATTTTPRTIRPVNGIGPGTTEGAKRAAEIRAYRMAGLPVPGRLR